MQLNKEYESEISLRDLFFYILYRWRSILLVSLILSILLGGYKYLSMQKMLDSTNRAQQEQIHAEKVKNRQGIIQTWTNQIDKLENYRLESVYFQLNPQAVWTASCKYLIKADPAVINQHPEGIHQDPADCILAAYSMLLSEVTDEEMIDVFGVIKPEYGYELMNVLTDTADNTVTLQVKGPTKEYAQKGLELIKGKIDIARVKAQTIDAHTLLMIGEETVLTADKELMESQETIDTILSRDSLNLNTARTKLSEVEAEDGPQNAGKQVIKFLLIGFILGMLVMICSYTVCYVFKDTVKESREISEQYNLTLLGEIRKSGSIHNNKGLDKLISRCELGKENVDEKTEYNNISAIINEKQGINNILLVSSLKTEELKKVKEALASRISPKEIEIMGEITTNSKAVSEITKSNAVILVEQKYKTRKKDLNRIAEILSMNDVRITGAIVL